MAKRGKTERLHTDIARWMKAGYKTIQQAATKYKVSTDTIRVACLKHDVPFSHEMSRQREEAIIELLEEGKKYQEAAEHFEVGINTIHRAVRKSGYKASGAGRQHKHMFAIIADLLQTQLTQNEIAARHGSSRQAVYNILCKCRDAGIKFETRK